MNKVSGFTLLEVLIAGFILFLAVSTATMVYTGALKSKINATESLRTSAYLPLIRDHIAVLLESTSSNSMRGNGHFLGVHFEWEGRVSEQKPIVSYFSEEQRSFTTSGKQAKLWKVSVTLMENRQPKNVEFEVVGWSA